MAKAPAVVIVVRHGARLDAADKSWHLTSPTPYDPPLTYGGWLQSRALGLRIASLLNAREQELENTATSPKDNTSPRNSPKPDSGSAEEGDLSHGKEKTRKRKHKVFVHTSPFQRCVQTSIGISAGLEQYDGYPRNSRKGSDARIKTVNQLHSSSPRLHAVDSPRLESIPEPLHQIIEAKEQAARLPPPSYSPPEKATLRVDAFLGEWLSPDYFEHITHPPNSTMMVAGAKANLLRKSENVDHYTPTVPKATGMWGTPTPSSAQSSPRPFPSKRDRANSSSSAASNSSRTSNGRSSPFRLHSDSSSSSKFGYDPPVPTYAVSPVDPIPRGYVSHAKDACVNIDYQWDSMRAPHYWGDGGSYGEEWSAMHKRFRRGLNSMLDWYSEHAPQQEDTDEEVDEVLVLVTHGAGCNALIGALTNQPVLIDVGMASLTMAVRRDGAEFSGSSSEVATPAPDEETDPLGRTRPLLRRNSVDLGLGNVYDLKVVASSEHLRPGVNPAETTQQTPTSPMLSSQMIPEYRRRYGSQTHAAAGAPIESSWNIGEPRSASTIGPSGMRRGSVATARPEKMRTYSLAAAAQVHSALEEMKISSSSSPTGLWSSPATEKPPSPGQDFVLDFSNSPESSRPSTRPSSRPTSRPTSRPSSGSRLATGSRSGSTDVSPRHTPAGSLTPAGPLTPAEEKAAAEEAAEVEKESDSAISDLPAVGSAVPHSLGRSLSQKGLWGSAPSGLVSRERGTPKRRWTLQQQQEG